MICSLVIMLNLTTFPWNKRDYEVMDEAKERCVKHFSDAPCVKKFIKSGEHDYQIVCGKEEK